MKTLITFIIVLASAANAMAVCEYSKILDADDDERINFSMKVNSLTQKVMGISFEKRDNLPDEISAGCMACHDGTLGPGGDVKRSHGENSTISGSHPIGADYNNISYTKNGYRNIHNIRASIKFVDGRLGCLSCHDLQNKEKNQLSASMNGSMLCFECHAK
ncbi:doubled CXXCH motif protein [Geobacter sp. OR-1]|uniref:cytochrome c3 family protein n=1 Tax=Geobacter sp. OR-1 TaxID=1266765 RepID=UPI0005433822|nr:cytochrome c3 family protein [Geobacter sp. OR-1]GAM11467.1 doubled CXXCH motif protein [Geobacter sp. OR-1]